MESFTTNFPFRKLIHDIYLTLDVIMNVDRDDVFKYIFSLNKEARHFLYYNFTAIHNGYVNEGLITHTL
jgi:methylaspartate ammonia-lyase